ncbi:unnamed protein product [Rodentolepis nana]|uniref:C2H2-type domain-containing protein n=1 Tax=Rodentolepis nana TaxID=102285 RepID=A0A0R3TLU0_RODNA|nr:unnamed protein product [Rodentolepis nana]
MDPFGRSVLRRDYASRQNTNTAPVYGNEPPNRSRSRRLPDGVSYSVHRVRQQVHNMNHIYGRVPQKTEEPRSRQPGHNQTEQARRHKETQLFNQIQTYSDFEEIRPIRNLYSDKDNRTSETKGTVRLTKKVLLNTTHSAIRVDREELLKNLFKYRDSLINLIEYALGNDDNSVEYQTLQRIKSTYCRVRDCERCDHRFSHQPTKLVHSSSHRHTASNDQRLVACGLPTGTLGEPVLFGDSYFPSHVSHYEVYQPDFFSNPSGASSSVSDFTDSFL